MQSRRKDSCEQKAGTNGILARTHQDVWVPNFSDTSGILQRLDALYHRAQRAPGLKLAGAAPRHRGEPADRQQCARAPDPADLLSFNRLCPLLLFHLFGDLQAGQGGVKLSPSSATITQWKPAIAPPPPARTDQLQVAVLVYIT